MRGIELQYRLLEERQEKKEAKPTAGGKEVPTVDGEEGLVEDYVTRHERVRCHFVFDKDEKHEEDRAQG